MVHIVTVHIITVEIVFCFCGERERECGSCSVKTFLNRERERERERRISNFGSTFSSGSHCDGSYHHCRNCLFWAEREYVKT